MSLEVTFLGKLVSQVKDYNLGKLPHDFLSWPGLTVLRALA